MSRTVRRVALGFSWPLGKPWAWASLDEPPSGAGWQLWETVSEGSPVSPVFATAEELAQWLTTAEGAKAVGPSARPLSIDQALAFVAAGSAPTGVVDAEGCHDGAAFVGSQEADRGRAV